MFDPALLQSFVTVAELGSFTRAAERLHATQSTISAQIRRLEAQAGRPLFVRTTRSVGLTDAGEALLGFARTILHLNQDAAARLAGTESTGALRLGVAEDLAGEWLAAILRRFRGLHPAVGLELEVGIGASLRRALDEGRLDVVVGGRCGGDAGGWPLWREPLVWAFAHGPMPRPLPLAVFPEPCPYREAALRSLAAAGLEWRIQCTSPSLAGVRAAAQAGLAATPLPRSALRPGLRIGGAEDGLPPLPNVEFLVCTAGDAHRPAALTMADLIRGAAAPGA